MYCKKHSYFRRPSVLLLAISVFAFPFSATSRAEAAGRADGTTAGRPNILLINIDDMGYGDISAHGNPRVKTPHLDRLHNESIRFKQFHVTPMCTPTRGALLTGMDPLRAGARWVGTDATHLRTDLPVMSEILQEAGYRTGLFGKWHTGDNYPFRPQDRGFEKTLWFPQQEIGTVGDYWSNDYFDDVYIEDGVPRRFEGFCTDVWFNEAMQWMKEKNADEPFFCMIPTNVTHGPYYAPEESRERFGMPHLPKEVQTFFATLLNLDDNIGRLLAFLEREGLEDNTIVIFMTDNGATMGFNTYNAGMKGMKINLWEGGHRVPLFIRWPEGNLREPGSIHGLAQVQDLLPTLLDLADVAPPAKARFNGISLAPVLRGERYELPDRKLVVQFQRKVRIDKWDACIMWGPWRLLNAIDVHPGASAAYREEVMARRRNDWEIKLELYNVELDPHQDNDLIDVYPQIVKEMKAHYEAWWEDVQPEMTIRPRIRIGNEAENPSKLNASSWANVYFTQKSNILEGARRAGDWRVIADESGTYRFTLRRWPEEAGAPLSGSATYTRTDAFVHGPEDTGVALPITEARLRIGDQIDQRKPVAPDDTGIEFTVELDAGPHRIETWFLDENAQWLCGAYHLDVLRE